MPEKQAVDSLEKTFDPAHFEERWYSRWEKDGRFQPQGPAGSPRYVMVIPPPNVTGRLHIGHAYGRTIEDILARWQRMRGHRVLWLPGTDHAGIATQMVVERELAREGHPAPATSGARRSSSGSGRGGGSPATDPRAAARGWGARSTGAGCGSRWTRISRAPCAHAFVRLYRDGLIYRGRYVVNWCPRCETAVSDLEVVHRETAGHALPRALRRARRPRRGGRGDDAARDDARRHGAGGPPGGRADRGLCGGAAPSCRS